MLSFLFFMRPHRYALRNVLFCEFVGLADCVCQTHKLTGILGVLAASGLPDLLLHRMGFGQTLPAQNPSLQINWGYLARGGGGLGLALYPALQGFTALKRDDQGIARLGSWMPCGVPETLRVDDKLAIFGH